MIRWLRNLFRRKPHEHEWEIAEFYAKPLGIYMYCILATDRNDVPLECKCGATAMGKWRVDRGLVEINIGKHIPGVRNE